MRLSMLLLLLSVVAAAPAVRLDVLVHPAWGDSVNIADSLLALATGDNVPLLCAGRILAQDVRADTSLSPVGADSLLLAALGASGCRWAAPQEYHWRVASPLIAACNVESPWSKRCIVIEGDSLSLGVLTLLSPDTAVRYPPGDRARYLYDLPATLDSTLDELHPRCDLVLLASNLPAHVLEPLLAGRAVDGVLSFDYKPSRADNLNGVPFFGAASTPALWRLRTQTVDGRATIVGERTTP